MTARKYNYDFYLNNSTKLNNFLEKYKDRKSTHRAYKLHLVRYFQNLDIKDIDHYVKDTRMMDKKEKIKYLDKIEEDLRKYWIDLNKKAKGKTPYIWLSAIKMFLIHNKTFELDNVFIDLQKNGHGNYAITNTKTPTKEQLLKIFSYSNPESKAIFMFQMVTGQRIKQVINTTFDNIEGLGEYDKKNRDYDIPRVFYPHAKQKYVVKTRITPECKKILIDYLEQREKFIETRTKRGNHCREGKLDMNKVFPMDVGTANAIWNTMLKNAGLYELDPNSNRPVYGTHCLRRYFLSHFSDREWGDFFSGHITPRNKEYRQYSDEKLDEIYKNHVDEITVFESNPDLTEVNKKIAEKDKQLEEMQRTMEEMKGEINELRFQKLERDNKKVEDLVKEVLKRSIDK